MTIAVTLYFGTVSASSTKITVQAKDNAGVLLVRDFLSQVSDNLRPDAYRAPATVGIVVSTAQTLPLALSTDMNSGGYAGATFVMRLVNRYTCVLPEQMDSSKNTLSIDYVPGAKGEPTTMTALQSAFVSAFNSIPGQITTLSSVPHGLTYVGQSRVLSDSDLVKPTTATSVSATPAPIYALQKIEHYVVRFSERKNVTTTVDSLTKLTPNQLIALKPVASSATRFPRCFRDPEAVDPTDPVYKEAPVTNDTVGSKMLDGDVPVPSLTPGGKQMYYVVSLVRLYSVREPAGLLGASMPENELSIYSFDKQTVGEILTDLDNLDTNFPKFGTSITDYTLEVDTGVNSPPLTKYDQTVEKDEGYYVLVAVRSFTIKTNVVYPATETSGGTTDTNSNWSGLQFVVAGTDEMTISQLLEQDAFADYHAAAPTGFGMVLQDDVPYENAQGGGLIIPLSRTLKDQTDTGKTTLYLNQVPASKITIYYAASSASPYVLYAAADYTATAYATDGTVDNTATVKGALFADVYRSSLAHFGITSSLKSATFGLYVHGDKTAAPAFDNGTTKNRVSDSADRKLDLLETRKVNVSKNASFDTAYAASFTITNDMYAPISYTVQEWVDMVVEGDTTWQLNRFVDVQTPILPFVLVGDALQYNERLILSQPTNLVQFSFNSDEGGIVDLDSRKYSSWFRGADFKAWARHLYKEFYTAQEPLAVAQDFDAGYNYRGAYDTDETYAAGDMVLQGGSKYYTQFTIGPAKSGFDATKWYKLPTIPTSVLIADDKEFFVSPDSATIGDTPTYSVYNIYVSRAMDIVIHPPTKDLPSVADIKVSFPDDFDVTDVINYANTVWGLSAVTDYALSATLDTTGSALPATMKLKDIAKYFESASPLELQVTKAEYVTVTIKFQNTVFQLGDLPQTLTVDGMIQVFKDSTENDELSLEVADASVLGTDQIGKYMTAAASKDVLPTVTFTLRQFDKVLVVVYNESHQAIYIRKLSQNATISAMAAEMRLKLHIHPSVILDFTPVLGVVAVSPDTALAQYQRLYDQFKDAAKIDPLDDSTVTQIAEFNVKMTAQNIGITVTNLYELSQATLTVRKYSTAADVVALATAQFGISSAGQFALQRGATVLGKFDYVNDGDDLQLVETSSPRVWALGHFLYNKEALNQDLLIKTTAKLSELSPGFIAKYDELHLGSLTGTLVTDFSTTVAKYPSYVDATGEATFFVIETGNVDITLVEGQNSEKVSSSPRATFAQLLASAGISATGVSIKEVSTGLPVKLSDVVTSFSTLVFAISATVVLRTVKVTFNGVTKSLDVAEGSTASAIAAAAASAFSLSGTYDLYIQGQTTALVATSVVDLISNTKFEIKAASAISTPVLFVGAAVLAYLFLL